MHRVRKIRIRILAHAVTQHFLPWLFQIYLLQILHSLPIQSFMSVEFNPRVVRTLYVILYIQQQRDFMSFSINGTATSFTYY